MQSKTWTRAINAFILIVGMVAICFLRQAKDNAIRDKASSAPIMVSVGSYKIENGNVQFTWLPIIDVDPASRKSYTLLLIENPITNRSIVAPMNPVQCSTLASIVVMANQQGNKYDMAACGAGEKLILTLEDGRPVGVKTK